MLVPKLQFPGAARCAVVWAILAYVGILAPAAAADWPRYTLYWLQRTDVGSPGPRFGHALAYDSDRGVTVLFGGENRAIVGATEYFDDTWEYDGVSWKRITIDGPSPSARSRHAMCYDNYLHQVILFGGDDGDSFLGDVWNYESTGPQRGRWTHRIMALDPGGRAAHTMIFDYFGGRAIVAGGSPDPSVSQYRQTSQVWEWDNTTGQWFLQPQTVGYYAGQVLGAGLTDHMMLYDFRRRETVVLGGIGPFGTDLVANQRMFFVLGGPSPGLCGSPVEHGAIVYDGFHDIYFQFGGTEYLSGRYRPQDAEPNYERIWYRAVTDFPCGAWNPEEITVHFLSQGNDGQPEYQPGQRVQCAMVYDEKRRVTVMFGGSGGITGPRYDDTWEVVTHDSRETWVHFNYPGREAGTFELPYNTLAEGVSHVAAGGTLKIKPGSTPEMLQITKPMVIEAIGGPVTIGL